MIEKERFYDYFFPLTVSSPERLFILIPVPYHSSKALQKSCSSRYKAHDIACVL